MYGMVPAPVQQTRARSRKVKDYARSARRRPLTSEWQDTMQRINVTLQDVAAAAGVSKTTAASILRGDRGFQAARGTRERVQVTAARLGYRRNALAAALSSGRTHTVALLLPPLQSASDMAALTRTFGQDVFVAVLNAASQANLRVLPTPLPTVADPPIALKNLIDGRVDGLILVSLRDPDFVEQVYASMVPCVELSSGFGTRLVQPDNAGGAAAAVAHLAERGHRRIVHWSGGVASSASEQRRSGFLAAAAKHGLRPEEVTITQDAASVAALLGRPASERPTALFAFNDHQAFLTLDIARGLGLRVPEDLSVVGFDNNILAEAARPRLTTIYNPIQEQADAAIKILQALWRGETDPVMPEKVSIRLIQRQSTTTAPF